MENIKSDLYEQITDDNKTNERKLDYLVGNELNFF